MSPKRKIPSRKLPSRKFASSKSSTRATPARPPKKPLKPQSREAGSPQPSIPACFWEMGFESLPTIDELRQRYKELSLVLHPDARGSKQAFIDLRSHYEAAQAYLLDE